MMAVKSRIRAVNSDSLFLRYAIARKRSAASLDAGLVPPRAWRTRAPSKRTQRRPLDSELAAFELFFHVREKLLGVCAVDGAMIEAEREVSHLPNRDVVFAVR
jgi:hypothetical protein